jgi:diguanylate cyclase (GGDEF)-like protein
LNAVDENLFSLEAETAETLTAGLSEIEGPAALLAALDLEGMCKAEAAAQIVSYHWNIATDCITWSGNAEAVLGCSRGNMATGRQFASLLAADNITSRYDAVMRSTARATHHDGESFAIEYQFKPDGKAGKHSVWIEDHGRWYGGPDGTPSYVYGSMKLANERHIRDQEMSFLSSCDVLTGLMNRARMQDALEESIRNAQSEKTPSAFAIVAVSNLDIMNEAYGFDVADEVILALAERLRRVMRVGDSIARYSGSRFGIILNGCKPIELTPTLERFMRAVRDSVIETRYGPVWALLSIGAVSLPAMGNSAQAATAHAEEALSEAFRLPSDGYVIYTSSEERHAQRLLNARCATEIVSCLRDGLFMLAFQPIYDSKSRQPLFHEALLRMKDTTGAVITAGHLVPIAERLGLIRLIDRAVLQQGLATLIAHPEARISINISAITANDPRWNKQILELLAEVPEIADRLIIEVTETTALGEHESSRDFVRGLKAAGCGIAIDDFGAGFTSYRNLKELPITMIKLDGYFCRGLTHDQANVTYVKSMLDLAHAFGIAVVAEWVETEEDANILTGLGVDFLQGNLLGEPSITAPWAADEAGTGFDWAVAEIEQLQPGAEADAAELFDLDENPSTKESVAIEEQTLATLPSDNEGLEKDSGVENSLDLLKSILAEFQQAIGKSDIADINAEPQALAS